MPEFFLRTYPFPDAARVLAEQAERAGWDGVLTIDSQFLAPDAYLTAACVLGRTSTISAGTAVTNLSTRTVGNVANSALTLATQYPGRFHLGLARGDTSVHLAGLPMPSTAEFTQNVVQLRAYLAGSSDVRGHRIQWLGGPPPAVPVNIFATGPRNLAVGARFADYVTITRGADVDRIAAARELVLETARSCDRHPPKVGAFVVVAVSDDEAAAIEMARAQASVSAHLQGESVAGYSAADRSMLDQLRSGYDAERHATAAANQTALLTDDFVRQFTVVGDVDTCANRLRSLLDIGLDHLVLVGAARDIPADRRSANDQAIVELRDLVLRGG